MQLIPEHVMYLHAWLGHSHCNHVHHMDDYMCRLWCLIKTHSIGWLHGLPLLPYEHFMMEEAGSKRNVECKVLCMSS